MKPLNIPLLFSALAAALLAGPAQAQTYIVQNSGFEAVSLADGASQSGAPNWGLIGSAATLNPTTAQFPAEAPEGQNILRLTNSALVTQSLGTLLAGTYVLEARVGLENGGTFNNLTFRLRGNTLLLVASSQSSPTVPAGDFVTWSRTYEVFPTNANASALGTNLNILLLASASTGSSAAVDDVRLTFTPVPEPSTLALAGLAAGGALATWRYRRFQLQEAGSTRA